MCWVYLGGATMRGEVYQQHIKAVELSDNRGTGTHVVLGIRFP